MAITTDVVGDMEALAEEETQFDDERQCGRWARTEIATSCGGFKDTYGGGCKELKRRQGMRRCLVVTGDLKLATQYKK